MRFPVPSDPRSQGETFERLCAAQRERDKATAQHASNCERVREADRQARAAERSKARRSRASKARHGRFKQEESDAALIAYMYRGIEPALGPE